jgi:hypothetical protein
VAAHASYQISLKKGFVTDLPLTTFNSVATNILVSVWGIGVQKGKRELL